MLEEEIALKELDQRRRRIARLSNIVKELKLDRDSPHHEQLILEILGIPESHRNNCLKETLADWMGCLEFFNNLRDASGEGVCRKFYANMTAGAHKQGEQLIKIGDDSEFFYIILRGSVMVLCPRKKLDIEEDTKSVDPNEVSKLSHRQRILLRRDNENVFKGVPIEAVDRYDRYFNEFGIPVISCQNILEKGRTFGQLGILYKTKRIADVICRQDSLIGRVSKERYLHIVGQESQRKIAERLLFLEQHFFSSMRKLTRQQAHRYLYLFEQLDYKVNSIIFEIDTPIRGLYIIKEGCVVVICAFMQLKTHQKDTKEVEAKSSIQRQYRRKKLVVLKELAEGECFGIESFLKNPKRGGLHYDYQAESSAKLKILFCPYQNLAPVLRSDKELEKQLKDKFKIKEDFSPIHPLVSVQSKLQKYNQINKENKSLQYRINSKLLQKPNVIRSPKSQSYYEKAQAKESLNLITLNQNYQQENTSRNLRGSYFSKEQVATKKNMSKALEICLVEDVVHSLQKRMANWKKHKAEVVETNRLMERELTKRNVETRLKHIRSF